MRYPDIYKDKIVFTYEGDLWLTTMGGGIARRLTNAPGIEYSAKFSPDGKWIAFTGSYDGSSNVYVIPSEGGEPVRVTYQPGGAQVVCWTPDGERIVYRSVRGKLYRKRPESLFCQQKRLRPRAISDRPGTPLQLFAGREENGIPKKRKRRKLLETV